MHEILQAQDLDNKSNCLQNKFGFSSKSKHKINGRLAVPYEMTYLGTKQKNFLVEMGYSASLHFGDMIQM